MSHAVGTLLLLAAAFCPLAALAAMETATESASYAMSDSDSRVDARQKCADAAKRIALDRAGSVFEATMTTNRADGHGQLADDAEIKMRSYFAAVVSSEVIRTQMDVFGDATRMSCDVKITYDPEAVTRKLAEIADAEGLRKQVAAQQATIAELQNRPPAVASAPGSLPQTASAGFAPSNFPPPPIYAPEAAAAAPQATAPGTLPGAVPPNYQPPPATYQMAYQPAPVRVQAAPPAYLPSAPAPAGYGAMIPYPQVTYAAPVIQLPRPRAALMVYRPHWQPWPHAYRRWNRVR